MSRKYLGQIVYMTGEFITCSCNSFCFPRTAQGHRMPFEIVHEDVGAIYEAQMKRSNPQLSFDFTVYHNLTEVTKDFSQ